MSSFPKNWGGSCPFQHWREHTIENAFIQNECQMSDWGLLTIKNCPWRFLANPSWFVGIYLLQIIIAIFSVIGQKLNYSSPVLYIGGASHILYWNFDQDSRWGWSFFAVSLWWTISSPKEIFTTANVTDWFWPLYVVHKLSRRSFGSLKEIKAFRENFYCFSFLTDNRFDRSFL